MYSQWLRTSKRTFSIPETFIFGQTFFEIFFAKISHKFIQEDIFELSLASLNENAQETLLEVSLSKTNSFQTFF